MEVTDIRVALRAQAVHHAAGESGGGARQAAEARAGEHRLKAYATVTFDHCFVVRNIKVIEGRSGLFVAMPSHRAKTVCARCQFKNDVGGRFCVQCGNRLPPPVPGPEGDAGEFAAHRDIAHPITVEFRQYLQQTILAAYDAERTKSSALPSRVGLDDEAT